MSTEHDFTVELNNFLQEHETGNLAPFLRYVMTRDLDLDGRTFHIAIAKFHGVTYAEGTGTSKRAAKRDAAMQVLEDFSMNGVPESDFTVELNNFLQEHETGNLAPFFQYVMTRDLDSDGRPSHIAIAKFRGITYAEGWGTSKRAAKRDAARQVLEDFSVNGVPERDFTVELNNFLQGHETGNLAPFFQYVMTSDLDPDGRPSHIAIAKFHGVTYAEGRGTSKRAAKRDAARQVLEDFSINGIPERDFTVELNNFLQRHERGNLAPFFQYVVTRDLDPDGRPSHLAIAKFHGVTYAEGWGASKRAAKRDAARQVLEDFSVNGVPERDFVAELYNFLQGHETGNLTPFFQYVMTREDLDGYPTHIAIAKFHGVTYVEGRGTSRHVAKGDAARQVLEDFSMNGVPERDFVTELINFLQGHETGNLMPFFQYVITREDLYGHLSHIVIAKFRGVTYAEGRGTSQGAAKRDAARQVLDDFSVNGVPGPVLICEFE